MYFKRIIVMLLRFLVYFGEVRDGFYVRNNSDYKFVSGIWRKGS